MLTVTELGAAGVLVDVFAVYEVVTRKSKFWSWVVLLLTTSHTAVTVLVPAAGV